VNQEIKSPWQVEKKMYICMGQTGKKEEISNLIDVH